MARRKRRRQKKKKEQAVLIRNAKASVFTDLFSDSEYQRDLYGCLTGDWRSEDEFRTITLENYLVNEIYNDLGFLVGDELIVLCEAQSTWSDNIVYRLLCYLVLSWKRLQQEQEWDIFSPAPVPLPEPKLYVFYTGGGAADNAEPPQTLKLSEIYYGGRHVPVEVEVTCLRHGQGNDILQQYKHFTEIVNETMKTHGRTREAAMLIIDRCLKEDVLVSYIEKRGGAEMVDMLMGTFDELEAQRIHTNTLIREHEEALNRKWEEKLEKDRKAWEDERWETIVQTSLSFGADRAAIIQRLVAAGLDKEASGKYLEKYLDQHGVSGGI